MKQVNLIRFDPAVNESLASDPAYFEAMMAEDWSKVAELVYEIVGRVLRVAPMGIDELAWDGYGVMDLNTREVVGSCAFKGEPDQEGAVEIAYFTYPGFEGRGYATLMAGKLIELARGSSSIKKVIAHTLPKQSASTRVLDKVGMKFHGEVIDPEDGPVWRWELDLVLRSAISS